MAGALGVSYSYITSQAPGSNSDINTKTRYYSEYKIKGIALFGFLLTFCLIPYLSVASLYHTSQKNAHILFVVPINMYLALGAGTLGVFAACTLAFRKMRIFELIFVGLNVQYLVCREASHLALQATWLATRQLPSHQGSWLGSAVRSFTRSCLTGLTITKLCFLCPRSTASWFRELWAGCCLRCLYR